MPIYQFICEKCCEPYEMIMTLKDKDKLDKKVKSAVNKTKCPTCKKPLSQRMCPVHLSSDRACL